MFDSRTRGRDAGLFGLGWHESFDAIITAIDLAPKGNSGHDRTRT